MARGLVRGAKSRACQAAKAVLNFVFLPSERWSIPPIILPFRMRVASAGASRSLSRRHQAPGISVCWSRMIVWRSSPQIAIHSVPGFQQQSQPHICHSMPRATPLRSLISNSAFCKVHHEGLQAATPHRRPTRWRRPLRRRSRRRAVSSRQDLLLPHASGVINPHTRSGSSCTGSGRGSPWLLEVDWAPRLSRVGCRGGIA